MQDDLHDALRWAVDQGLVDAGRVCIMGASYGGYAALMGPVRHPGDYRCAVSWVAPTDLPRLVDDFADGADAETRREIEREIGRPAELREASPLRRVAQLKVPVLAAWGVDDRRIPLDAHGRAFRDAARAAGVALEYVEYPQEGHVWLQPATRLDFFGRAEALLHRALDAR
jgi:dipeptidyl aminopeptidase/acylaminoacyl peptidase